MEVSKRGTGGKRVNRLNLSVTNLDERNLKLLARSVDVSPSKLAYYYFQKGLYDPSIINYLQNNYNLYPQYKILPVTKDGRTWFVLNSEMGEE